MKPPEDFGSRRAFEATAGVLLDAVDTLALVLDATGRVVLANRACEALLGIPAEKMLGRSPLELGFGAAEPCPEQAAGDAQVRTASGELRLVAWSSRILLEPDGSLRCVVATGSDVTKARATERSLRESEGRFRELAENVNDLVAELTIEGSFAWVNPRFEAVLGFAPEELLGRSVLDYVHPADHDEARSLMREFNGPGVSRQITLRVRERSGAHRPLESVARAFAAPDGGLRLAVISRDVSQRAATDTELRREDRLVALGTFATAVAQQINSPIAAILLAAEVALERPRPGLLDSRDKRALASIAEHAHRCAGIVRSMLDFAAQGRGAQRLHDVNELVARAIALVDAYAREHGARVRLDAQPGLPRVRGNGIEIEQLFVNLLRNALESRSSGVSVEVETRARDGAVRISMSDDGEGVPDDATELIFEPFYSTKQESGGTGLGLAICRRIVAEHGGEIRVEHRPLGGTRFSVDLPVGAALGLKSPA